MGVAVIRLYVNSPLKKNTPVSVAEKDQHYLLHVMRQKEGDEIFCFNGIDGEWRTQLNFQNKKKVMLIPIQQTQPQTKLPFLALCPALIKKDNFDFVLQKATELGVTDIYPLITDYTVHPHFNQQHAELVIKEAAEQSERLTLPLIHKPLSLRQLRKALPENCCCCYLEERTNQNNILPSNQNIAFIVGPEGGWSPSEKEFLSSQKGFYGLHFETGILRAETASIAILSCWQLTPSLNWKK